MSKSRAFVLEPCAKSVNSASEFGELNYVFEHAEHRPSIWSREFLPTVLARLERMRFVAERDYFVVSGHMVPVSMVLTQLAATHGSVKCLFFNAVDNQYVERRISNESGTRAAVSRN